MIKISTPFHWAVRLTAVVSTLQAQGDIGMNLAFSRLLVKSMGGKHGHCKESKE
jgi:hypothetical protein